MSTRVSANEFCVTVAKACVARGVERSVAKEMALACCLLEERGIASLPVLDAALAADPVPLAEWRIDGATVAAERISGLHEGCAALDLTAAFDIVRFQCDAPVLIEGLALLRGATLRTVSGRHELSRGGKPSQPRGPIAFRDPAWWRRMERHAAGILVPATDATRADAGAGTTDND